MIKIKTSFLRDFLKKSAEIETHNILPLLEYIELRSVGGTVIFTKTNQKIFCRQTFSEGVESSKDKILFLEEKTLHAIAPALQDEHVLFQHVDNKIEIYCGKKKTTHGVVSGDVRYPEFPDDGGQQRVQLTVDFLSSVKMASIITTPEPEFQSSYVFTKSKDGNCIIDCTNMYIAYRNAANIVMPDTALNKTTCDIISQYNDLLYCQNLNYDFFKNDQIEYAFIKPEIKPLPFNQLYDGFENQNMFYVSARKIQSFCDGATKLASPTKKDGIDFLEVVFKVRGNKMLMFFEEKDKKDDDEIEIDNKGFPDCDACFNARNLLKVLKTVPYETIGFVKGKTLDAWYIIEDSSPDYVGLAIQLNSKR